MKKRPPRPGRAGCSFLRRVHENGRVGFRGKQASKSHVSKALPYNYASDAHNNLEFNLIKLGSVPFSIQKDRTLAPWRVERALYKATIQEEHTLKGADYIRDDMGTVDTEKATASCFFST